MAYAKNRKRIGFALTPEDFDLLKRNMEFYKCKSYGQYFKLKLKTDNVLYESLMRSSNGNTK